MPQPVSSEVLPCEPETSQTAAPVPQTPPHRRAAARQAQQLPIVQTTPPLLPPTLDHQASPTQNLQALTRSPSPVIQRSATLQPAPIMSSVQESCEHNKRKPKMSRIKEAGDQFCEARSSGVKCKGDEVADVLLVCRKCELKVCRRCWNDRYPQHSRRDGEDDEKRRYGHPNSQRRAIEENRDEERRVKYN